MAAHLEGQSLGHYRLLSLIGRGGMGEVYLSENERQADDVPQRKVAIKVVPVSETTLSTDAEALRIFREGRFLLELSHPHILPLYHDGIQDDYLFLVMPYMPDGSLADAIHARSQLRLQLPVELERVADYIEQIASALQYTHDRHIVHRDVKPGNVLVEVRPNGHWHLFLADFGIARNVETTSNEEGWRGTVAYMAPEQFRGQMSPAADQYALAVLAFQLLSGQVPFAMSPPAVRTLNPAIPESVEGVLLQGLAVLPEERFASVTDFATAFRSAVGVKPETAAEAKSRADNLSTKKRYEEALSAYEQALILDPKDADAWYYKGNVLAVLNRYDDALAAFEHALTLDPKYANLANAWGNKGNVLANLKRHEEALAALDQALALDPKYAAAWGNKGNVLGNLKRYEEALAALEQALALDPKDADIWNNKGIILSHLERYEEAAEAYDHVVKLKPTNVMARHNRAMSHLAALASEAEIRDAERLAKEQAIITAKNAVGQNPESAEAWCNFGEALNQLKQYARANEAFDHAIALDPQWASAWANQGAALLGLDKCEDAVGAYDHALAIDAENADTWANKAVALFRLMRYEEAASSYDHAVAINPDYGVTSEVPVVKAPIAKQDESTNSED